MTFGVRCHSLIHRSPDSRFGLSSSNLIKVLAISFPLDQAPPVNFEIPSKMPKSKQEFDLFCLPLRKIKSAGLLVKALHDQEPGNHYLVMKRSKNVSIDNFFPDRYNSKTKELFSAVMPNNSPLLKRGRVGRKFRVFAFPKEVRNDDWEENVNHDIMRILEKTYKHYRNNIDRLGKIISENLENLYKSKNQLIIFYRPGYACLYHEQHLTFGARAHCVTVKRRRIIFGNCACKGLLTVAAISFPVNQKPPATDFQNPTDIQDIHLKESKGCFRNLRSKVESAGLAAKALTDIEPRNYYFLATSRISTEGYGFFCPTDVAVIYPASSMVKYGKVGKDLHCAVFRKQDLS